MNCCKHGPCVPKRTLKLTESLLCATFLVIMASGVVFGIGEAVPAPLANLSVGISSSAVIDKIKSAGTYSLEPSPWDKRTKVIWQLPDNSDYEKVMFLFTEKDRLYLVRLTVKKEAWSEVRNLKKGLFDKFGIAYENPARLRIKDQDVLVYEGLKLDCSFFEFTDTKSGAKVFELYYGKISSEDKPKKDTEKKSDDHK